MRNLIFAAIALLIIGTTACNLEKEVDIDLPDYAIQPVVECYVEPDKPPVLLLTRSTDFFAPFDTSLFQFVNRIIEQEAQVTVKYGNVVDTLRNDFYIDQESGRLYNYFGRKEIPYAPGMKFVLDIKLKDGNTITSECVMPKRTPIDSILVEWNATRDSLARVLTYITDDPSETQFWRRLINYGSLVDSLPNQDFLVKDDLNTTDIIAFGTAYELKEGDTVYNTIYSVTESYYKYIISVQNAVFGNQNPFASPSAIMSNVKGTNNPLGIFAPVVYDRKMTIIKK